MIGFKTSRHSGQMFLTFKPRKSFYDFLKGGLESEVAQYSDFLNFSDMALETAIDPVVEAAAIEMAKTMAETLNQNIKTAMCCVWSNYTPTKPFLVHPQTLKDIEADPNLKEFFS